MTGNYEAAAAGCPFDHTALSTPNPEFMQLPAPDGMPAADELRLYMLDWYQKSGFRGCLFNKVAARDARRGSFAWHVPVEYEQTGEILDGEAGQRVLDNFESVIGDGSQEGLVSYMFPGVTSPREFGDLLKFLHASNPDRFRILDIKDRLSMAGVPGLGDEEFVGIQFRIKVGTTDEGEDALAYPMVYNPWSFTTFARRFDVPKITFNAHNNKQNPETANTFIGVDDVDLTDSIGPQQFLKMLERSVLVNGQAHSFTGAADDTSQYSRALFRAHNALVLPAVAWDD